MLYDTVDADLCVFSPSARAQLPYLIPSKPGVVGRNDQQPLEEWLCMTAFFRNENSPKWTAFL